MASTRAWLLFLFAGIACSTSVLGYRIVGGQETTIEEYPSIVQVDSLGTFTGVWSQSCGANILTSRWVLSAAHCFDGALYEAANRRVRAGSTYRNTGGQVVQVEREVNHPSYGCCGLGLDGDVSVILLVSSLTWTPVVQQGTIVSQGWQVPDNAPVVHAGWGTTAQGGSPSPVLLDVTIYTVSNDFCRERYLELPNPGTVTENMICAGLLGVGGRDACQGDSGGPLYYGDIIIGVVSWGHGCANASFPGVSAAVSPYTNWIIQTVA